MFCGGEYHKQTSPQLPVVFWVLSSVVISLANGLASAAKQRQWKY